MATAIRSGRLMPSIEYRKDIEYFLEMPGLASDSVGCVGFDGKYAFIQLHASTYLVVTPPVGEPLPSFSELIFYANCLGYDHDLPTFITPDDWKAQIVPVEKGPPEYINQNYFESLGMAFEAINSIRLGPLRYLTFRWPGFRKDVEIFYSRKYSKVSQELGLYCTALKQLDPLSEFLYYYRVIECVSGSNGKDWIRTYISSINTYDFGFLHFGSDVPTYRPKMRTNLFSVYRRRAKSRINLLSKKLSTGDIAEYFYNVLRCGIAHGRTDVIDYDYGFNIVEVSQDLIVLKLLARIAVEQKV